MATGTNITFDSNGIMTAGFSHTPGTAGIAVAAPGDYMVSFSASTVATSQLAVYLNGAIVAGSTYGSGAGTQQNTGQVIVRTTSPNDVITIRDHTTSGALALQTQAGGTEANTNASVAIEALG